MKQTDDLGGGSAVEAHELDPLEPTSATASAGADENVTDRCHQYARVLLRSSHAPADTDAWPWWRHLLHPCTCPPWGRLENALVSGLVGASLWLLAVSVTGRQSLPGGQLFSILCIMAAGLLSGWLASRVHLPPLLGMLATGLLVANVPALSQLAAAVPTNSSSGLRSVALMVILTRAGLGLDADALRRLSLTVLRLAFTPCLTETVTVAVAAHLLLQMPWVWAFMLGFVLSAVSPAVVVPCLLSLQERGFGVDQGIPTLVIAAASVDDVLAISGFGVLLGITFTQGSVASKLLSGPLELLLGLSYGVCFGVLLWFIPHVHNSSMALLRVTLLTTAGLLALFGSQAVGYAGAGALGCLTLAFVAGHGWRRRGWPSDNNPASKTFSVLWYILQPLLFGLIGMELRLVDLKADVVGFGILTLIIGLCVRLVMTFLVVMGSGLSVRDRLFVSIAWLPKATVQAAIGPVALDFARTHAPTEENLELGYQVVTIAVLVILITAPLGAAGITLMGPRLLTKKTDNSTQQREDTV